jgi:hypothetical protein
MLLSMVALQDVYTHSGDKDTPHNVAIKVLVVPLINWLS